MSENCKLPETMLTQICVRNRQTEEESRRHVESQKIIGGLFVQRPWPSKQREREREREEREREKKKEKRKKERKERKKEEQEEK